MSFGEDEYEMKHRRKNWRNILLPVMGLLLAGAVAGISFVGAKPITVILRENVAGVPEGDGLQVAVGFGIFLTLMLIFVMFYAIFAPKPTKMISEKDLDKEKKLRQKEKLEQKRRRRQVNLKMAQERREQNK
jgi:uncharacterized ion transporter superfamily protein YfcC